MAARHLVSVPQTFFNRYFVSVAIYGLGSGVGRDLGVGADLGVGVGLGVDVAETVAVGVDVAVAVAVAVGVGTRSCGRRPGGPASQKSCVKALFAPCTPETYSLSLPG